ncbi:MAG: DNA repair protein RecO [Patescibacteria group bacterium]|jgi:DNA repair protein RecO (recombination protein O)
MPTYRDQGIVLKTRPVRDADRTYTIYTANHGKITVLAQGTRRGKSKLSPHLSSFGVVEIMVAKGRRIDRLAGACLARRFSSLPDSLPKTITAQSFLLTVDSLTKRELPEERIFELLVDFFEALDRWSAPEFVRGGHHPVYDGAALKLLDILGFAPEFDACVRCRGKLSVSGNALNALRGGIECSTCRPYSKETVSSGVIEALRLMRRSHLTSLQQADVPAEVASPTSELIEALLVGHLEEGIRALRFMRQLA